MTAVVVALLVSAAPAIEKFGLPFLWTAEWFMRIYKICRGVLISIGSGMIMHLIQPLPKFLNVS